MSSALTVVLSLALALLGSSVIASVLSAVLNRKFGVDNRLWNARVSAYSRLLGKLLAWSVHASPSLEEIRSSTARPPTDFDMVRAEFSEAVLLASGDLRRKLEDFARNLPPMTRALDDVNGWFRSHPGVCDVDIDIESVPEFRRYEELRRHERALKEEIVTGMRRELDTKRGPAKKGSISDGDRSKSPTS